MSRLPRLLLRVALLGYPASLRREYGDEILNVFGARLDSARRRGRTAAAGVWLREIGGAIRNAIGRRLRRGDTFTLHRSRPPHDHPSPRERIVMTIELVLQDLRIAARTLRKSPGFALAAILVLALGIGADTAMFSVVDAVLLEPLPFADPDRLVQIYETNPERGWDRAQVAAANFLDWRERSTGFTGMTAHNDWLSEAAWIDSGGEPHMLRINQVTGNFFDLLGVELALGTGFEPSDTWAGGEDKVVVSHTFWRDRLGADPAAVGSRIELDGVPHTVVGVTTAEFDYPFPSLDGWKPTAWSPGSRAEVWFRRAHGMRVIGRLAVGATPESAAAELAAIAASLEQEYPETNVAMGTGLVSLHEWVTGDARTPLVVLFIAVGLVLTVACTNVANMQLARASRRGREMAIRAALGASRGRLVRQGLTESLLLASLGGVVGLGVAAVCLRLLRALDPGDLLPAARLEIDVSVLLFAVAVTLLTGVLFGLVPALRASGSRAAERLAGSREVGVAGGRFTSRLLVAGEIALVLPLVIGAGLLVRSMSELRTQDPGFDPQGVMVFDYSLPQSAYPTLTEVALFHAEVIERVGELPGVESVGSGTRMPFRNQRWSSDFRLESWDLDRYGVNIRHDEIAGDLFEALRVPVLQGTTFGPEVPDDRLVAVVNQAFVDEFLRPGEDPIGQRLCNDRVQEECNYWFEIVGVVGNVRRVHLAEEEEPSVYAHLLQDVSRTTRLYVRSEADPEVVTTAVRGVFRELDPALPFGDIVSLEALTAESLARLRLLLRLLGAFAALALVLAALGVYGVVAYTTAGRTREIGVRVTLGARPGDVLRSIVGSGLTPVVAGLVIGVGITLAGSRLLAGFLYGVAPLDPATYLVAAGVLAAAATAACLVPARRALRIDPVDALRDE